MTDKTNRLILDTDGGVDDAQALLMLIAAGRTPFAISTVFGNVSLDHATANMVAILTLAGVDAPVHAGADRPLNAPMIHAREIHGEEGLGGAARPLTDSTPASDDAVTFLRDTLRDAAATGDLVDVLMIGPLTNLALALRVAPDCIGGIGRLTLMGGSIHGRGNVTPAAEFNIYADPEAAGIVFGAEIDIVVVPWETCVAHSITGDAVDALFGALPPGREKEFSESLAGHARRVIAGFGHGDLFRFVDPLAAAVVVEPEIITRSLRASVDVALAPGLTRGMTVVDPSGRLGTPMVTLVEEVDRDRLIALFQASIAHRVSGEGKP